MRKLNQLSILRKAALAIVGVVGVGAIMATSPPEPDVYFEEANIRPSWRCPGTDVTFGWSLSEAAPVSVTLEGREYHVDAETKDLTVPADLFDRTDSPVEAALQIDIDYAYRPDRYEIRTLRHESWVDAWAYRTEGGGFTMNQGSGQWDRRIEVRGFQIMNVRHLVCEGEAKLPQSWAVTAPSGQTFELRAGEDFERRLDPGAPAGGVWKLQPRGADCRPARLGLQPKINIRLTAVCRQPDKSS